MGRESNNRLVSRIFHRHGNSMDLLPHHDLYRSHYGISIAVTVRSLDPSLITRLIPAYGVDFARLSVQSNRRTFVQSRAKVM